MKDIKLIKTLVISYFHENEHKINEIQLEEFLKESLNIDIGEVTLINGLLTIYYGPKNKEKRILFEIHKDKIKHKKDEAI
jgi:hypothetical protein